jgi:hypothetical protein
LKPVVSAGRSFLSGSFQRIALALSASVSLLLAVPFTALAATPPFAAFWVQNFKETHLWSGPTGTAVDYGAIPQWSYLQVAAPQNGPRLYVFVPWSKNYAFVDATAVGPSGPPPAGWVQQVVALAQSPTSPANWVGRVIGNELVVRDAPTTQGKVLRTLSGGSIVSVVAWVRGDELVSGDWTWAQLADGGYSYTEALQIIPPKTAPPPPADHPSGQWIDVNRLHETAVAYNGDVPAHIAIVSSGSPGWETPAGTHWIWRRAADVTMDGSTLDSLGLDAWHAARATYKIDHVLDAQYFDDFGDALHENYWLPSTEFGIPHSHGCVGMPLADAQWFWNWADYDVPVVVH